MNTMSRNVLLITALSTSFACSSGNAPVDIGDGRTGQSLEDYAAHWEGYAEAHDFSDGSDKVRLSLDAMGNGTLQFGDSPALPTATDPDVGYPLAANFFYNPLGSAVPGFSYPINPATVESARIRFSYNPSAIERDWCALQTSYAAAIGGYEYSCIPSDFAYTGVPGANTCRYIANSTPTGDPVDCDKAWLCKNAVCACDAAGCAAREYPNGGAGVYPRLDAALDDSGNSLVGTLVGMGVGSFTVRLKRVSSD